MNKILLTTLLLICSIFAEDGKEIFENNCASCHIMKMGWQITDKEKITMQGPPAFGITRHVRDVYSDEKQFIKFVSDYITKPEKIKSKCRDNVIKKFGLMPAVGVGMSNEDKEKVAKWMFDNIGVMK